MNGRYYNHGSPLEDRRMYSQSLDGVVSWHENNLLKSDLQKIIDDGRDTRVWSEH